VEKNITILQNAPGGEEKKPHRNMPLETSSNRFLKKLLILPNY
jgi:hypothetical protein